MRHAACMRERNCILDFSGEKDYLEDLGVDGRILN